jgi:hypothetical protein
MTSQGTKKFVYTEEQATHWLSWLAHGMRKHGQTVFLIEGLQPTWLSTNGQLWRYVLFSRLIGGLIAGTASFSLLWVQLELFSVTLENQPQIDGVARALALVIIVAEAAAVGVAHGTFFGLLAGLGELVRSGRKTSLQVIAALLLSLLLGVSIFAMVRGKDILIILELPLLIITLWLWTSWARQRSLENDIKTTEVLRWSWLRFWRVIEKSLSSFLPSSGCMSRLLFMPFALTIGLGIGLVRGVFGAYNSEPVEMKVTPNQGMRLTLKSAASAWGRIVIIGVSIGLLITLGPSLIVHSPYPLIGGGIVCGLLFSVLGLFVALWFGGLDYINHYILRVILSEDIPLDLVTFLDYAAEELHFLQRVGGGYMFIHGYLLEHFASIRIRAEGELA